MLKKLNLSITLGYNKKTMKSEKTVNIVHFALAYLLSFTCLYVYLYFDFDYFMIIFLLLSFLSSPSLLGVITLRYFSFKRKFIVHEMIYILLSIFLFMLTFLIFEKLSYDTRNLFPVFEEPYYLIFLLCIVANLFAFLYLKLIQKINVKLKT